MARCAVIRGGIVENIVVASVGDPAPEGCFLVEIAGGLAADIGWIWDGKVFINPNPTPEEIEPEPGA